MASRSFARVHPAWVFLLGALVASLAFGIVFAFTGNGNGSSTPARLSSSWSPTLHGAVVPFVVGVREQLAVEKMAAQGFKVEVRRVHVAAPAGIVTAQGPAAGLRALKGTVVKINVSAGPAA
jgi:beta-lactam-binding protein with PASTA domain